MFEKNLFGLEKNGDVKVWNIRVEDNSAVAGDTQVEVFMTIEHGKQKGKLTTKVEQILEGKQGRNLHEQGILQAQARVKKQLSKGYRESVDELTELPIIAMLAKDASMEKLKKVKFNYKEGLFISDKLDGFRCLAKCFYDSERQHSVITIESRTGEIYSVPHIERELYSIMEPGDIIDGELYVHGPVLQDISSAVKRTDPQEKIDEYYLKAGRALSKYGADSEKYAEANADYENALLIAEIRPTLEFRVFDVIQCDGLDVDVNTAFALRVQALQEYSKRFNEDTSFGKIFAVAYRVAFNIDEIYALHADAVSRGYEGVMIRTMSGIYESGKRSADLYKFKMFMDAEFLIEDIIPDKQGNGVFCLKNNVNFERFTCVMGDMVFRKKILSEKELYIGKWLKVKFQTRYKGTLLPQFPTGIELRECDENGNPLE